MFYVTGPSGQLNFYQFYFSVRSVHVHLVLLELLVIQLRAARVQPDVARVGSGEECKNPSNGLKREV